MRILFASYQIATIIATFRSYKKTEFSNTYIIMKWIHNLLKCFSFSAVLFTFEACYGTPEDMIEDYYEYAVQVVDGDGNGIPNVEMLVKNTTDNRIEYYADTTNGAGLAFINYFGFWDGQKLKLEFRPLENVDFQPKDTVIQCSHHNKDITVTLEHK